MRAETRKKLEARTLRARQKDALGNITNCITLSADEDEQQEDDPWLGTSLAGLMTDTNNLKRTALVGLEKVQSSTRAAKGFGRGTGDSPTNQKEKMSVFDIFTTQRKGTEDAIEQANEISQDDSNPREITARPSKPALQESSSSRTTSDRHRRVPGIALSAATSNWEPPTPETPNRRPQAQLRGPSMAARKLLDDFDDFEGSEEHCSGFTKKRPSPSRKDHKSKPVTDRKTQMNEIPTFLV